MQINKSLKNKSLIKLIQNVINVKDLKTHKDKKYTGIMM